MQKKQKFFRPAVMLLLLGFLISGAAIKVKADGEAAITFSEIMYDLPGGDNNREWVEIYNYGQEAIELNANAWRFNDGSNHTLRLVQGDWTLEPAEAAILTADDQTFLSEHQDFNGAVFDTAMSLNNNGGTIILSVGGQIVSEVDYSVNWGAGGNGKTLAKIQPAGANEADNWAESATDGGTPGIVELPEEEPQIIEQSIALRAGWNFVASYVVPEDDSFQNILQPLIDRGIFDYAKDASGRIFVPGRINQINTWQAGQAYQIKIRRSGELVIRGTETVSPQVRLAAGWNYVGYLLNEGRPVESLLACLPENSLEWVKNQRGNFYWAQANFKNFQNFFPGQGYLIKVNQDVDLDWTCLGG